MAWKWSIEDGQPEGESIILRGNSHIGMGSSPSALHLIADRLAQPENDWKPFEASGLTRLFYGPQDHRADEGRRRAP